MSPHKAVFLDKDGTLVKNVPYNADPDLVELETGAERALQQLSQAGFLLVVVSNQSGVARGLFPEEALPPIWERVQALVREKGAGEIAGFYYCPHHPEGSIERYRVDCHCRKPNPGMIFRAAEELNISLVDSWFVGDILDDVEAGRRAGCGTVLLDNGHETEWLWSPLRKPDFTVRNLEEAAAAILSTIPPDSHPALESVSADE